MWDNANVKVYLHRVVSCCTAWSRITPLIQQAVKGDAAFKGCTMSAIYMIRLCCSPRDVLYHHTKPLAQHCVTKAPLSCTLFSWTNQHDTCSHLQLPTSLQVSFAGSRCVPVTLCTLIWPACFLHQRLQHCKAMLRVRSALQPLCLQIPP